MSWKIKRIQEDDYGCEERPQNEKITVIVTLVDENGMEKQLRVEDDWLYAEGIKDGKKELPPVCPFPKEDAFLSGESGRALYIWQGSLGEAL